MQPFSKYQSLEYQPYNCEQLQGHGTTNHDEKSSIGQVWDQKALRRESEACAQSNAGSRAWPEPTQVKADADMWTSQIGQADKTSAEEKCGLRSESEQMSHERAFKQWKS